MEGISTEPIARYHGRPFYSVSEIDASINDLHDRLLIDPDDAKYLNLKIKHLEKLKEDIIGT